MQTIVLLACMSVCLCVYMYPLMIKGKRSHGHLWAAIWVLGIKPWTPAKHWVLCKRVELILQPIYGFIQNSGLCSPKTSPCLFRESIPKSFQEHKTLGLGDGSVDNDDRCQPENPSQILWSWLLTINLTTAKTQVRKSLLLIKSFEVERSLLIWIFWGVIVHL